MAVGKARHPRQGAEADIAIEMALHVVTHPPQARVGHAAASVSYRRWGSREQSVHPRPQVQIVGAGHDIRPSRSPQRLNSSASSSAPG